MTKPNALASIVFAGGFTVGVEKYFKTLGHVADDNYGFPTFQANWPHIPTLYFKDLNVKAWLKEQPPIDLVYANPPCAIFSQAGYNPLSKSLANWETDPRTSCWVRSLNLGLDVGAKIIAVESVQNALSRGRPFIEQQTARMQSEGYAVTWLKVNARRHGVPQKRPRFFLLAHQVELTFGQPQDREVGPLEAFRRYGIQDGPDAKVGEIIKFNAKTLDDLYGLLRPGEGGRAWMEWDKLHPNPERRKDGKIKGRPAFTWTRLHANVPSFVMLDRTLHPLFDRTLGVEEVKAMLGFPPDFVVAGQGHAATLLTRGVTPPVAEYLARQLRRGLDKNVKPSADFFEVDRGTAPDSSARAS